MDKLANAGAFKGLRLLLSALLLACMLAGAAQAGEQATTRLEIWRDETRQRDIPIKAYLPSGSDKVPIILFSHGVGGSRNAGEEWGSHWAEHGFISLHLQHPGSDTSLLTGGTGSIVERLGRGANATQLIERLRDVMFAIDELARRQSGSGWTARADLARIGMAGHSFGAITTQYLAGQRAIDPQAPAQSMAESRIRAFVAFSPSAGGTSAQADPRAVFGQITAPFFSITGTEDHAPSFQAGVNPLNRTVPFQGMPAGNKYLLVLDGADHMVLGGRRGRADFEGGPRPGLPADRQIRIQEIVKQASLAFWKASLLGDKQAESWLGGEGLKGLLLPGDRLETSL